ncbi:hypothetical protein [Marinobacterium marinum]|uniref:Uncharacterized protein n=1 Tax=Marinobacterium marinum TaxID=2756129 RepID=A0A7W2ABJ0_9GAMM|nr:hypothetical protein [Marinobacterium marinum]MBA4501522.1 hypothetical protein [Marinobacterium marinum]
MDLKAEQGTAGNQSATQVLNTLLDRYLSPAFGALPKLEVELIMLDALEQLGVISPQPQVYELVSKLKVTRTKANKLLYERELRRSTSTDLDSRVKELLRSPLIDKKGTHFMLEVDNPLLLDHLRDKVRKLGYISDGSFSSSLVKLSVDAFVALVEDALKDELETAERVLKEAGAPDTSIKGVIKAACSKLAHRIASDTGEAAMQQVSDFFGALVGGKADELRAAAVQVFQGQ